MLEDLIKKIKNKTATICVLGLGRVGLPFAALLASKGVKVFGIDNNEERIQSIINSRCPFYDPTLQRILEEVLASKNLKVMPDLKKITEGIDIIIVTVGTPTVENIINYSQLYSAVGEICHLDLKEKIIILRSTMPPNTTKEIIVPLLEQKTKLKAGIDFGVAVCPERILEGKAIEELQNLPEIIGGINNTSNEIATELFKILNAEKDFLYTTPSGAELGKLFANIYRYINFALSNEFAIWAERYGLNANELIKMVNYNYPRSNIPIPGFVGGPCLSKDGSFLDGNTTFASIVTTAFKLNEAIPKHIVNTLKDLAGGIFNKKITVLGLSFKAGSDDIRQSPSVKLIELLKSYHADVLVHDPHVKGTMRLERVLREPEIVIIATNHKEFKEIIPDLQNCGCKLIYDVWSMFNSKDFPNLNYVKFGQGLPKV